MPLKSFMQNLFPNHILHNIHESFIPNGLFSINCFSFKITPIFRTIYSSHKLQNPLRLFDGQFSTQHYNNSYQLNHQSGRNIIFFFNCPNDRNEQRSLELHQRTTNGTIFIYSKHYVDVVGKGCEWKIFGAVRKAEWIFGISPHFIFQPNIFLELWFSKTNIFLGLLLTHSGDKLLLLILKLAFVMGSIEGVSYYIEYFEIFSYFSIDNFVFFIPSRHFSYSWH